MDKLKYSIFVNFFILTYAFVTVAVFTHAVITGHKFTRYKSDAIKNFSLIHQRVHTSRY